MSVHFEAARSRWVVRWREGGRNRSRTFKTIDAAEVFDAAVRRPRAVVATAPSSPHGDGIYPYGTRAGVRFRFVFDDHRLAGIPLTDPQAGPPRFRSATQCEHPARCPSRARFGRCAGVRGRAIGAHVAPGPATSQQ